MFKYDKTVSKLERFNDFPEDKQSKILKKILTDDVALEWQFDPGKDHQPYTVEMVKKFYKLMAAPSVMKAYPKMIDRYGKKEFSRSSAVILNSVLTFAIDANNEMVAQIRDEYSTNGNSVDSKDMKVKAEKYAERLDDLKHIVQSIIKPYLKELTKETGLTRDLVFRALMVSPEPKYLPQYRISSTVVQILEELYSEANASGFPRNGSGVKWKALFKELFGVENVPSVAVSILLEGMHHIDQYRDSKNAEAVRDCWDSLTKYALDILEHTDNNMRNQMIELYLKKAEGLIARRNGRPTDLRVNLTRLPREFSNLIRTVGVHQKNFEGIYNKARFDRNNDRRPNDNFPVRSKESESEGALGTIVNAASKISDLMSSFTDDDDD